jgi:hypothetical protein
MKFKIDENMPLDVTKLLRNTGHNHKIKLWFLTFGEITEIVSTSFSNIWENPLDISPC